MVGRGAAKNLGNRKNIGNSIHEDSTSFVPRLRTYACQPQINDIRLTEDENPNMDVENQEIHNDHRSGFASNEDIRAQLGKRKRTNKLNTRISKALGANVVVEDQPIQRREENVNRRNRENNGSSHSVANDSPQNGEATSKVKHRGERGKYKSSVVDMLLKEKKSKLKIYIPDDIDRAIGDNARHLVNECGRVVRTKAPLDVKDWKEAFAKAGESTWREIQNKFEVKEGSSYIKMQAFSISTMQRLYNLWKTRLHYYYKRCGQDDKQRLANPPPDLPEEQWKHCVAKYGSEEFKKVSQRNSKNRLSKKRTTQTTGNLSFVEVEHIMTEENNGVKPSADVIWLIEHTTANENGNLEWADESR